MTAPLVQAHPVIVSTNIVNVDLISQNNNIDVPFQVYPQLQKQHKRDMNTQ